MAKPNASLWAKYQATAAGNRSYENSEHLQSQELDSIHGLNHKQQKVLKQYQAKRQSRLSAQKQKSSGGSDLWGNVSGWVDRNVGHPLGAAVHVPLDVVNAAGNELSQGLSWADANVPGFKSGDKQLGIQTKDEQQAEKRAHAQSDFNKAQKLYVQLSNNPQASDFDKRDARANLLAASGALDGFTKSSAKNAAQLGINPAGIKPNAPAQTPGISPGRFLQNVNAGTTVAQYREKQGVDLGKWGNLAYDLSDNVADPLMYVGPGELAAGSHAALAARVAEDGGEGFRDYVAAGRLADKASSVASVGTSAEHAERASVVAKLARKGPSALTRKESIKYLGGTGGAKLFGKQNLTVIPQEVTHAVTRPLGGALGAVRRAGDGGKGIFGLGDDLSGKTAKELGPAIRSGDEARAVPAVIAKAKIATNKSWVSGVSQNLKKVFVQETKGLGKDDKALIFRAVQGDAEAASALSDEGARAAHAISGVFSQLEEHARAAGIDLGHIESYFPHYRSDEFAQHLIDQGVEQGSGAAGRAARSSFEQSRYKWGDEFAGQVLTPVNGDTSDIALSDQMNALLGRSSGDKSSIFNENIDEVVPRAIDAMTKRIGAARTEQALIRSGVIRPKMVPEKAAQILSDPLAYSPAEARDALHLSEETAPKEEVADLVSGKSASNGATTNGQVPPPVAATAPNGAPQHLTDALTNAPQQLADATGGKVIRQGDHILIHVPDYGDASEVGHVGLPSTAEGVGNAEAQGERAAVKASRRGEYLDAANQAPRDEARSAAADELRSTLQQVEDETGVRIPLGEDTKTTHFPAKGGRPAQTLVGHNYIIDMKPWADNVAAQAKQAADLIHPQAAALDANDPSIAIGLTHTADPQYATQQYLAAAKRGDDQGAALWQAAVSETDPHLKQVATLEAASNDAEGAVGDGKSTWEKALNGDRTSRNAISNALQQVNMRGMRTLASDPTMVSTQEVADVLHTMSKAYEPNWAENFLDKTLSPVVQWLKTWQVASPRFQIKTAVGNVYQNWISGVVHAADYTQYERLAKAAAEHFSVETSTAPVGTGRLWRGLSADEQKIATEMHESNLLGPFSSGFLRDDTHGAQGSIQNLFERSGHGDLGRTISRNNPIGSHGPISRLGVRIGAHHVEWGRGAMFVGARTKGYSLDETLALLDKFHFNYEDLSPTERAIKRVVPFYTFTRHNLPLQVEMLAKHPGKMRLWMALKQNIEQASQPDQNTPSYFNQGLFQPIRTPFQAEGGALYAKNLTPQFELNQWQEDPGGSALGMLTPVVKTPLEHALGHRLDPVGSYPLNHKDIPMPASFVAVPGLPEALHVVGGAHKVRGKWVVGSDVADDVANVIPILGQARRLHPGDDPKGQRNILGSALAWGTGLLQTNTRAQQQATLDSENYAKAYKVLDWYKSQPYKKGRPSSWYADKDKAGNLIGQIKAGKGPKLPARRAG